MNIIYGTYISEQISPKRSHHTRSIVNNNGNRLKFIVSE